MFSIDNVTYTRVSKTWCGAPQERGKRESAQDDKLKKIDFPPLFAPGIHPLSLEKLEEIAVAPFPNDPDRLRLFLLLMQWMEKLRALQVSAILWIDGSFVTQKAAPGDIDCIVWHPSTPCAPTLTQQAEIAQLLDRIQMRAQFGLDLYVEFPTPDMKLHREAYWRGLFGFQHNGTSAKGFVELKL
jgi:hypothetical protein